MIQIDNNLSLKTFQTNDFEKLFETLSDNEVMKHTGFKKCLSKTEAKEIIRLKLLYVIWNCKREILGCYAMYLRKLC